MPRKKNWDRGADKELVRREKFIERLQAKATKSRERAERTKYGIRRFNKKNNAAKNFAI